MPRLILALILISAAPAQQQPEPLYVSPEAQEFRLVYAPAPVYPAVAREARIEGTVKLEAIVDRDGRVAELRLIGGHPFLVNAAMDAVKQWRYRPTIVNLLRIEVRTRIEINFTLRGPEDRRDTDDRPHGRVVV